MDIFTFISELTKAVIWPITVISLAILLGNPIFELFTLLRRLKYEELELEFAQEISELKTKAIIVEQGVERNILQVLSTSSNLLNPVRFSTRVCNYGSMVRCRIRCNQYCEFILATITN